MLLQSISERLTLSLIESSIIDKEDEDLYQYGILQGFRIILNLVSALIIGLLFGKLPEIVLFMTAYIPLRSYAGGFHAKTPPRCYVLSVAMLCLVSIGLREDVLSDTVLYVVSAVSAVTVLAVSPVEDKNKPLDEAETRMFRKKAIIILAVEFSICTALGLLKWHSFFSVMAYELACMSIMLLAGLVKNSKSNM